MLKSIYKKIRMSYVRTGIVLCSIVVFSLMTGCGSDEAGSTPAKYFRYDKEGNKKDGEYIVIKGLNTACNEKGKLKVNLNDIWEKYQGKIVFPEKIDGLPVKKVDIESVSKIGEKMPNTNVYVVNLLDSEKMLYADEEEYNKLVTEVVVHEGLEKCYLGGWYDIKLATVPLRSTGYFLVTDSASIVVVQGSSTEDKLPEYSRLGEHKQKVTLPECIKKIDLDDFAYCKELICSSEAMVFTYKELGPVANPKLLIAEIAKVYDGYADHEKFDHMTINGVKMVE